MTNNSPSAPPNPIAIFAALTAYQNSAALKGAIDLDLFTAIGEGAATVSDIARRCGASERGTRILCDYLVVMQMLNKHGDRYELTPDAAMFLDRRSPACLGSAASFLLHPFMKSAYDDLADTVRTGRTQLPGEGSVAPDNRIWVDFARGMAPLMFPAANEIAKGILTRSGKAPASVLDIAAGHGMFGIAVAKEFPQARITACDWPAVLEVAQENAAKLGVGERVTTLPGNAMEVDFGGPYDLVLLTNFLHHFDPSTNEALLRKVRAALAPEGRAVTLEFVPNDDRVTPPMQAGFALTMLASTKSGDAYTFRELEAMFRNGGFARSEIVALQSAPQSVVISYV